MTNIKLVLLILLAIFTVSTSAKADAEKTMLPDALSKIDWHKNDKFSAYYKALGKETLKEGDKYYYAVKGIKYPISLHKKPGSDEIERIYFRILGKNLGLDDLKNYLKENGFTPAKDQKREDDFMVFSHPQKKMKLKFKKSTQNLYSVEKWF